MPAPLLNEYKINFASKRIYYTFTSSVLPPRGCSPLHTFYIFSIQTFFCITPFLFSVVLYLIYNDALPFGGVTDILFGLFFSLITCLVSCSTETLRSRSQGKVHPQLGSPNLTEEDAFEFDDEAPFLESLSYIFIVTTDPLVHWIHIPLKTVLIGFFASAAVAFLSPAILKERMHSESLGWFVFVFGWLNIGILWSEMIRSSPPPAPNTMTASDRTGLDSYSRFFYLAILLVCFGLESVYPVLIPINIGLYVVFACFPIIWTFGWLPSTSFYFLSCNPLINHTIGISEVFLSLCILFASTVTSYYSDELSAMFVNAVLVAFFSAQDSVSSFLGDTSIRSKAESSTLYRLRVGYRVILMLSISLCFRFEPASLKSNDVVLPIFWTCFSLISLRFVLCQIKSLFLLSFLPIIRNPLRLQKENAIKIILGLVYLFVYQIEPFLFTALFFASLSRPNAFTFTSIVELLDSQNDFGQHVWIHLTVLALFKRAWNDISGLGIDLYLLLILYSCIGLIPWGSWWTSQILSIQLLMIRFARILIHRLVSTCFFWILLLKHFILNKKQKVENWILWLLPILVISPFSLFVSILNFPCMSLLGLPLLWPSFPRTFQFWSTLESTYSSHPESILYSSMIPSLLDGLSLAIRLGDIPTPQVGDAFLVRMESRILLIRILQQRFDGLVVSISGSELEPTSCHAIEGTVVDELLDHALSSSGPLFNTHFCHTLSTQGTLQSEAYSESKMVTTGILDHPHSLAMIPSIFYKILTYILFEALSNDELQLINNAPIQTDILIAQWRKFPMKWFIFLKNRKENPNLDMELGQEPTDSDQSFILVTIASFAMMMGIYSADSQMPTLSSRQLWTLYKGDLPTSLSKECKEWFQTAMNSKLRFLALKAFRFSIKMVIDQMIDGEPQSMAELKEILSMYTQEWFLSTEEDIQTSDSWTRQISEKKIPNIFLLSLKKENGTLSVRILSKQLCSMKLASMNSEGLKSVWSNLVYELLYLTNDDDERYSIQAHELILRNLTIQLAAPPFGYPIWMSMGYIPMSKIIDLVGN